MGVMETIAKAVIQIGADTTGLDKSLTGMSGKVDKAFGIIKTIITGAAAYAVIRWTEGTVALGVAAEKSAAVFTNTMKTAANAPDAVIDKLKEWASSQERITGFDAEDLMDQMGVLAMKTGDAAQAQAQLETSMNLARGRGLGLAEASNMVSMATMGMTRTWKQLGLELEDGASKASIMDAINKKVAGAAATYAKTSAGQLEVLKVTYESMRETLGTALLPIVNSLATALLPIIDKLTNFITAHKDELSDMVQKVADKIGAIVSKLGELNLEKLFNTIGKIAGGIGLLMVVESMAKVVIAVHSINGALIALAANPAFWPLMALAGIVVAGAVIANKVDQIFDKYGSPGANTNGPELGGQETPVITGGRGTVNRGVVDLTTGNRGTTNRGVIVPKTTSTSPINWGGPTTAEAKSAADASDKIAKDAKAAAEKVAQAAKEAAAAIEQARQGVADKIFALTHTDLENSLRVIAQERDANIAAHVPKMEAEALYQAAKSKLIADADKESAAKALATEKEAAENRKAVINALTQTIIDNYQLQENAAVKALEGERDARVSAINDQIEALTGQRNTEAKQDKMAGLAANFANATTEEARATASKALMDGVNEAVYQDQLATLEKEQKAVTDAYNDPKTGKIASATLYYDNLKLIRNADAEAEKMLTNQTQTDTLKMLTDRLGEWKSMGTQIGDSLYSGLQSAITLIGTSISSISSSGSAAIASLYGGGSSRAVKGRASGGMVGLSGPEIVLVGEKGPEYVTSNKDLGNNNAVLRRLDDLIAAVTRVAPGVAGAINGIGRSM